MDNLEPIIKTLSQVRYREKQIPLTFTGGQSSGGFTTAYEFVNPQTDEKYFLKIIEISEGMTDEIAVLGKINQVFRNEILSEPDPAKRLNYMPVPEIITDDPDRFNVEFMRALDRTHYKVQLQTAGAGTPAEKQLPDTLAERLLIAIDFAKILRACARNRIAYVDVKPLEHIFWINRENRMEITLIDWGIARANASSFLLIDDIRKFCIFLPELIYGRKMLDLVNHGKFEYPIQKENDRVLVRLLGQLSFNTNNPPLNQKYALLVGDLLTGAVNDARILNRCVDVWDDILRALNETVDQLKNEVKSVVSWESLRKEAESLIAKDPQSFMTKDFQKCMDPRLISLASYKAWLLPAIRFLQIWYGRIDLIPHQTFDVCAQLVVEDNPGQLELEFQNIANLIAGKVTRSNGNAEMASVLLENVSQIQDVITAWKAIDETESGSISPEIFQTTFSTSNLRVIDPLLADAYRKQSKKAQESYMEPVEVPTAASEKQETPAGSKGNAAAEKASEPIHEAPITEAGRKARALAEMFSKKGDFAELRSIGFFNELNDLFTRYPVDIAEISHELESVSTALFAAVENWVSKVNSDRFVVADEDLNSLDWAMMLPQAVGDWNVIRKEKPIQVGEYIRGQLFATQNELARASSASIELNLNLQIRDLLNRIKALRKKLDTENMAQFKVILSNGDYDTAKQIIDLHYLENPQFFERLRTEMSHQQDEGDDKKAMALINSLLNDLSTGGGNMETGKYIKNQNNLPYINQKISSFRQKNAQLFDIQDELTRTKNLANDARKASSDLKQITMLNVILLIVVIVLSVALLAVVLMKNFGLEKNVGRLESNLRSFQQTYEANVNATPLPTLQQVVTEVVRPSDTPVPTPIPTLVASEEIVSPPASTADESLLPADRHLNALVDASVMFNLDGNVDLFGDAELTNEKKLGIIINYVQNVNGVLAGYNERAVNLLIPFNISRGLISASTMSNVVRGTNIRQFSDVPAETTPVFITQTDVVLNAPAANCTDSVQSFCHGTISVWIERSKIESTIK